MIEVIGVVRMVEVTRVFDVSGVVRVVWDQNVPRRTIRSPTS